MDRNVFIFTNSAKLNTPIEERFPDYVVALRD